MNKKDTKFLFILALAVFLLQIISLVARVFVDFTSNSRIFFGLFAENTAGIIISSVVFAILFYLSRLYKLNVSALTLMLTGILSNILDRVFYGGVIDYIRLFSFPVFNLADILICVGAGIIIIQAIKKNPA